MKKLSFISKVFRYILFVFIISSSYPQTITSLSGLEDSIGNTHLFYRFGTNIYNYNSIYHLDVKSGTDTLFFPLDTYDQYINDYDFWNNNVSRFIRSWGHSHAIASAAIYKYNGSNFGGEEYTFRQISISKQDSNLVYIGGHFYTLSPVYANYDFVLKSTDAGENWNVSVTDKYFVSLCPFDDTQFFVIDGSTKLYKTIDAGKTFSEVDTSKNDQNTSEVIPEFFYDSDSLHIYRSSKDDEGYYLSRSDNKGDPGTWQIIFRENTLINIAIDNSVSGSVYLANGVNLYYSSDYGANFSIFKSFNETIAGVYKKPYSDTLYVATEHSIYEVTSSSVREIKTVLSVDDGNHPYVHRLYQNYPNPFNPTTNIGFRIAKFGFVSLKVYDILGREIATLVNEEKHPGNYEVKFNGSDLSSGIYFYRFRAGNYASVKKMILMK